MRSLLLGKPVWLQSRCTAARVSGAEDAARGTKIIHRFADTASMDAGLLNLNCSVLIVGNFILGLILFLNMSHVLIIL